MYRSSNAVQTYEYSVYGQVAAEDPNRPNPYLFTGRRFDIEIGLYYYRARYYDPFTGRFLQTDPVGYDDGMNWYAYCGNNPLNYADPSGNYAVEVNIPLATIWHWSSVGALIDDKYGKRYVTEGNDPQHKSDVQGFLDESNFKVDFPDVTLKSVTYSGSLTEGFYHCEFEVPDDYDSMRMGIDDVEGIPILVVKTGHWYKGNLKKEEILDWRLIGMLHDPMYHESDTGKNLEAGIAGQGVAIASAALSVHYYKVEGTLKSVKVGVPGSLCVISAGASVYSFYKVIFDPGGNVPGFEKWQAYYDYLDMYPGGINDILDRYNAYKKKHKL